MILSDALKNIAQLMEKITTEKNCCQKRIEDRRSNLHHVRKEARETLMLARRNIDLNYMSPIISPYPSRTKTPMVQIQTQASKSSKRLEMLEKWKEEREKRKREAMRNAKPIFKVCHVTNDIGVVPQLENVSKKMRQHMKEKKMVRKSSENVCESSKYSRMSILPKKSTLNSSKNILQQAGQMKGVTRIQLSKSTISRRNNEIEFLCDEEKSYELPRKTTGKKSLNSVTKNSMVILENINQNTTRFGKPLPTYISPFVTISRGKNLARKEFQARLSTGGSYITPDSKRKGFSDSTSPKMGAEYFSILLNQETERIKNICGIWENYSKENNLSEEAHTLIFVAVGQSRLLITKKFQQFRGLIEKCRKSAYEDDRPITCKDLHGFWDMIYMQVVDVEKRFSYLDKLRDNNWEEVVMERKKEVTKRPRGRPKKSNAPSRMRDFIRAARTKNCQLDDVIAEPVPATVDPPENVPVNERFTPARRSLRVSLLRGQSLKRHSTSPCLTMMKITQAIKSGDGVTPSRSILKIGGKTNSERRMRKSVLFKDDPKN